MSTSSRLFERDVPIFVESESGRIGKYPRSGWARWGLRLLIALPFAALGIWFQVAADGDWSGTANGALADRVGDLPWGSPDVSSIGDLYPPISSLIARVIPGGALGLSIAGSLVAGLMLQLVIQALQRKGLSLPLRIVFLVALAITPVFAYIVTTSFEAALGLMFFGLGMIDLVRFVTYANTQAGFRAGILFACSAFSDSTGLLAALVAALAATFIIQSRQGSRIANAIVVVFPTLAVSGALILLGIAFGLGPLAMIRGDLSWDQATADAFVAFLATPAGVVYLAPTLVVVVTSLFLRFPGIGLVAVLLTLMTVLAYIIGLTPPGAGGNNYILMLLLAVAVVPSPKDRLETAMVVLTASVLWVIGWASAAQREVFTTWMSTLSGGAL